VQDSKNQTSKIKKGPGASHAPCMVVLHHRVPGSSFAVEVPAMNKVILQRLQSIQNHLDKIKRTEYPPSHEGTKQEIIRILEERKERRMRELLKGK